MSGGREHARQAERCLGVQGNAGAGVEPVRQSRRGGTIKEYLDWFPGVEEWQVKAVLEHAIKSLEHESPVDHGTPAPRPDMVAMAEGPMSIYRLPRSCPWHCQGAEPRRHVADGIPGTGQSHHRTAERVRQMFAPA